MFQEGGVPGMILVLVLDGYSEHVPRVVENNFKINECLKPLVQNLGTYIR